MSTKNDDMEYELQRQREILDRQNRDRIADIEAADKGRWTSIMVVVMIIGALRIVPLWVSIPAVFYCLHRSSID